MASFPNSIFNTDVEKIRNEIDSMIHDIQSYIDKGDNVLDWESTLKRRYTCLQQTSNTLFHFIIRNYGTDRFDKEYFKKTIDMMLKQISQIQKTQTTQQDASERVGEHLASTFIPQLKK